MAVRGRLPGASGAAGHERRRQGQRAPRTALGLIPDGPQGQYVMVANMDQNGIEYPAYHWGTE